MRRLYSGLGRFDVRFRYLIVVVWLVVTIVCVRTLPGLGSVAKDTESGFLPSFHPISARAGNPKLGGGSREGITVLRLRLGADRRQNSPHQNPYP